MELLVGKQVFVCPAIALNAVMHFQSRFFSGSLVQGLAPLQV